MIQANYSYYDIDLSDIWYYQSSLLLNGYISIQEAKAFLERIQLEIFRHNEPVWVWDSVQSKNDQELSLYYKRTAQEYAQACSDIKDMFRIEFFVSGNKCFQYDRAIIIDSKHPDFDYWFSLKLKQYQYEMPQLAPFLDYQLEKNFESNKTDFAKFLTAFIWQHIHDNRIKELMDGIRDWIRISSLQETLSSKTKKEPKPARKKTNVEAHSLYLKALKENPDYFVENSNAFLEAFMMLKEANFIAQSTNLEDFKAIFSNTRIKADKRVKWVGAMKELQWFITFLMNDTKKIDFLYHKWSTVIACFVDEEGNEFKTAQLKDAKGGRPDRKQILEQIVNKI